MRYYVGLLKAIKQRFGDVLRERGLVISGEELHGELKIIFRAAEEGWRLPTALYVAGPLQTGRTEAAWSDVAVEAQVFEAFTLGPDGPRGFVDLREDYFELGYMDSEEQFFSRIAAHLASDPVVPWDVIGENVASEEVTVAYATVCQQFDTTQMAVVVENDEDVEAVSFPELPGGAFRFEILKEDGTAIAYVGGEEVARTERPCQYEIQSMVSKVLSDAYDERYV